MWIRPFDVDRATDEDRGHFLWRRKGHLYHKPVMALFSPRRVGGRSTYWSCDARVSGLLPRPQPPPLLSLAVVTVKDEDDVTGRLSARRNSSQQITGDTLPIKQLRCQINLCRSLWRQHRGFLVRYTRSVGQLVQVEVLRQCDIFVSKTFYH